MWSSREEALRYNCLTPLLMFAQHHHWGNVLPWFCNPLGIMHSYNFMCSIGIHVTTHMFYISCHAYSMHQPKGMGTDENSLNGSVQVCVKACLAHTRQKIGPRRWNQLQAGRDMWWEVGVYESSLDCDECLHAVAHHSSSHEGSILTLCMCLSLLQGWDLEAPCLALQGCSSRPTHSSSL